MKLLVYYYSIPITGPECDIKDMVAEKEKELQERWPFWKNQIVVLAKYSGGDTIEMIDMTMPTTPFYVGKIGTPGTTGL